MKNYIYAFSALLLLSSCEEVIELDLNESDPKLVVEGVIEEGSPCIIQLSKTTNFFTNEAAQNFTNATILLSDSEGNSEYLTINDANEFSSTEITGVAGNRYDLYIVENGHEYRSVGYIPNQTKIMRTIVEQSPMAHGPGKNKYMIMCQFLDDEESSDYYRVRYYKNGEALSEPNDYVIINDELNNGEVMMATGFRSLFAIGDTVTVELLSIDKGTYNYFKTLIEVLNSSGLNAASPFNPTSNIGNDALGYFGGRAVDRRTIIVDI